MMIKPKKRLKFFIDYNPPDLSHLKMKYWKVIRYAGCFSRKNPWYQCRCQCGNEGIFPLKVLVNSRLKLTLVKVLVNSRLKLTLVDFVVPKQSNGPNHCGCLDSGPKKEKAKAIAKMKPAPKPEKEVPQVLFHKQDPRVITGRDAFPIDDLYGMRDGLIKLPAGLDMDDILWQIEYRTQRRIWTRC